MADFLTKNTKDLCESGSHSNKNEKHRSRVEPIINSAVCLCIFYVRLISLV